MCLPAPWRWPRRGAPLPSPQAANGQLAAVADGRLVTLNPDGSGLRTMPVPDAGQITELAFSPGGNRIAFVKAGELSVLELTTGRIVPLTSLGRDANPAWSADGLTIGFRRGAGLFRVAAAGGGQPELVRELPNVLTTDIAWAPDLQDFTAVVAGALVWPGLALPPAVTGVPAWAPDRHALAFARPGGLSTIAPGAAAEPVLEAPAGSPRWAPDSSALVFVARGAVRTLTLATRRGDDAAGRGRAARAGRLAAMRRGRHAELRVGRAAALQRARGDRLDADRRADRPAGAAVHRPCRAPADADVVKDAGSRDGLRPALHAGARLLGPGHGRPTASATASCDSEIYRVTRLRRPAPARDGARPGHPTARARPGRAVPERERDAAAGPQATTLVRVSCDQDCSMAVRLSATLRTRKTFTGPQVRRTISGQAGRASASAAARQAARDAEDGVDHRAGAQRGRRRPHA